MSKHVRLRDVCFWVRFNALPHASVMLALALEWHKRCASQYSILLKLWTAKKYYVWLLSLSS